jgi:hypothetical protein
MQRPVVIHRAMFLLRAAAFAALAAGCLDGRSQDEPAPQVRESLPEIFYMQDDAGRLVPVPGFRYRDFVDLLRIKEGLPGLPEAPAAVLENVVLRAALAGGPPGESAVAEAAAASCSVSVELTVRQARPGWVSLPVGLDGLLLTAAASHEGPGQMLLAAAAAGAAGADAAQPGFRLWLSAPAAGGQTDVRHVVRLEGTVAVDASPSQESISLDVPRATASLLEIKTPRDRPLVSVRPPALSPNVGVAADGAGSVVTLVGVSGRVRIRIGARGGETVVADESVGVAAVPQSTVETIVRIDGRVALTEAGLRIENLPPGTDSIRVALPARSTLRSVRAPATLVRMDEADARPVAVLRVDRAADGRCLVDLETERPVDPTGRETFEPLGFVVEGIPLWRQWGRASLIVDGDWQVEWDDAGGNRRIDPPVAARRPGFVAAFAFDSQPARLPLRVRPRGSRVVIEPEYRYEVAAARVSFDARLRVSVRGAPASRIVVQLGDWEIDEVGPNSVVDAAAVSAEGGRLVIPFVQPLSGDAVVEIRGGMRLGQNADRVEWRIPVPQADLVGPASIVIGSQSDIELLPDAEVIRGLVRYVAPTALRSDADRPTLAYRLDGGDGTFAATRRFLPRRVDGLVAAQVDIDDANMLVRETIRFDVAHVPLEFISLDVPEEVARSGTLEIRQGGQLLNPIEESTSGDPTPESFESDDAAAVSTPGDEPPPGVRLRAMLAVPLLGAGEVTLQYEVPTPAVPPEATVAEDLPLVLPAGVRIGRQSMSLTAPETLTVDVRGGSWKRDATGPGLAGASARLWTTARPQRIVPLAVSARQRAAQGETEIEAAWLQTLLSGSRRQDVYAYAITSSAEQISLTLPAGIVPAEESRAEGSASVAEGAPAEFDGGVEVRLDGRRQPDAVRADGRIVVDLPQRATEGAWLLEVVCLRPRRGITAARMPGTIDLESPRFPAGTTQRRFYWELLLEPDDHVIHRSGRWTAQQRWQWDDAGPRQVPVVPRSSLAAWLAAAVGDVAVDSPQLRAEPPGVGARLVYSGVGPPGEARLWIVPTWLLVLAVSGPVLAVGLLAVYRPWMRGVPALLALATLASLAAAIKPDLAPLVAGAAIPGVALAAIAAALRAWLRTSGPRPAAPDARVSASSLTRAASHPSLIIASQAARADAEPTAISGRNLP